ncbi:MAG: tetratricopeptide repeat protein [Cyclobacteriaceae bacterium]
MKAYFKKQVTLVGIFVAIAVSLIVMKSCQNPTPIYETPLFDNLGKYRLGITTESEAASRFVTQGIIMANGFNHAEAARSFHEAIRQDSTCAMAWWGLAYVLGPNYNTNSSTGENKEILDAVDNAVAFSSNASPWEKALVNTLRIKYGEDGSAVDEEGYAAAMKNVYDQFSDNDFIVTLYGESLMNLHAWDLYTRKGGEPKPWTPDIVSVLENALQLNPENPLANHLYLHATEAAPDVEKALVSAERLKTLVPGAGHLVHMPSHIYINTGDYHEGSLANEEAVKVDSTYIAQCQAQGVYPQLYYPHNWHFLSATAALEGRGGRSIEAAFKTADIIDRNYLRQDGFGTTQHYITIPYNVLVKFAQWEKVLALPAPDDDLDYPKAIWHYAQGMALANTGKLERAKEELAELKRLSESDDVKSLIVWEINSASELCTIASNVLEAEIFRLKGDYKSAEDLFKAAIALEDQLNYNEPPDWFFSIRHFLGDLYMDMERFQDAESVYREDLTYWVKNGFALNGLRHALLKQGKEDEGEEVRKEFAEAWKYADSQLRYSRIDEASRTNLAIKMDENAPNDLVYIAGSFCK